MTLSVRSLCTIDVLSTTDAKVVLNSDEGEEGNFSDSRVLHYHVYLQVFYVLLRCRYYRTVEGLKPSSESSALVLLRRARGPEIADRTDTLHVACEMFISACGSSPH